MLDTSAYSGAARGHPELVARLRRLGQVLLSPIAIGELLDGFARGRQEKRNRALLRDFLRSPRVSIPILSEETSERYASIMATLRAQGTPVPTNDVWIAAQAMEHGVQVLTTDADFKRIPQVLVDFVDVTREDDGTE